MNKEFLDKLIETLSQLEQQIRDARELVIEQVIKDARSKQSPSGYSPVDDERD